MSSLTFIILGMDAVERRAEHGVTAGRGVGRQLPPQQGAAVHPGGAAVRRSAAEEPAAHVVGGHHAGQRQRRAPRAQRARGEPRDEHVVGHGVVSDTERDRQLRDGHQIRGEVVACIGTVHISSVSYIMRMLNVYSFLSVCFRSTSTGHSSL